MNIVEFHPYVEFFGNCESALHYYEKCFGGQIVFLQYYDEAPTERLTSDFKKKVMHSEFKADSIHFMACDIATDTVRKPTNTFAITFADPAEQQIVFNALADGGHIQSLLDRTVWGNISGMVTDRYGVHWILNCDTMSSPNK